MKKKHYNYSDKLFSWIKNNSLEDRFDEVLENTEYLDLSWTEIETIPNEISRLKKLKSINLQNSAFKKLPDSIIELEYLESIDLKFSDVEHLPENISSMKRLEYLNLDCSNVSSVPEEVGDMTTLNFLQLKTENFSRGREYHCPLSNCSYEICPINNIPSKIAKGCSKQSGYYKQKAGV
jgi:hypothetical protein